MRNKTSRPPELEDITTIQKAMEVLEAMNFSEYERDVYEARLKWLRDEEMAILTAEKRGVERGRQEVVKIAAALIKGENVEVLSKELGVTVERVNEIKKQLGLE